jgi:hypothetical protein
MIPGSGAAWIDSYPAVVIPLPEMEESELVLPATSGQDRQDSRIWGFWPTIGFSLAIFFSFVAAQSVVGVAFLVAKLGSVGSIEQLLESLTTDGLLVSLSVIASAVLCTGLILLFIRLKGTGIKEYLGLVPLSWRMVLALVGLVVLLLVALEVIGRLAGVTPDPSYMADMEAIYQSSGSPVILWLAVAGFAPLFEEVFFRGFLFIGIHHSRLGAVGAVLITAIFWSVMHLQYDIAGLIQILVLGIVFGIVRLKTKSLWSTLLMHSLWNAAAMLAVMLSLSGN